MNQQPRLCVKDISKRDVPTLPGVYAWYRGGQPVYAGRAAGVAGLRARIWANHLRTGNDLSRSSFRRNVCEYLGIAPTSTTTIRPTVMGVVEVDRINRWVRDCHIAWITCGSPAQAAALEKELLAEWLPPLSRR